MKTELVTTLKREATRLLEELRESKEPIMVTEYGKPAAYLVDVESYHEKMDRIALLEGIARGEKAIREGNTVSNETAKESLQKWLP